MARTPSPPRGPLSPQGTFARFRAAIDHEQAEKARAARLGFGGATAAPNNASNMKGLIAARRSVAGARSQSRSNSPSLGLMRENPRSGEYWVVETEGKEGSWPGLICDTDLVTNPAFLNRQSRPISAIQTDGTWDRLFTPSVDISGRRCFPVLLLKKLKFHWVPRRRLLSRLDVQTAIRVLSGMNIKTQREIMEAYKEVMEDRDLGYWKSEIVVKNLSNDESSSKSTLVSKRKRADGGPGIPHATETDDCEDDDESHLFAKEPKVKQEPKPSHSPPDSSDEESTGPRMKRQKGSMSMKELTPSTASKPVPQQKISDDQVRIYVGNPQHHFMVPKAGLKQSDLLQSLIECENGEAYIMSPLLSSIDPLRFKSVAEYLDYGEYVPSLLNEGSSKARLDIVGDRGRRSAAMEQCSIVFKMGEDLQLSGLQDLVVRKFRVLTPEADDDDFVLAAGRFNSEGRPSNPDLHEFMVARFAQEHFSIWIHRSTLYRQFCLKHRALEIEIQRKRVANYDEEIAKAKAEKTEKEDDDPQSAF